MSQLTKHVSAPIDTSDPWSDDVLKRRALAQQLTAALSTVTQPFVLGLHGEFGNGKTFFIKRWQQELLTRVTWRFISMLGRQTTQLSH